MKKHHYGDVREDGMVFRTHFKRRGETKEHWLSPEAFARWDNYCKQRVIGRRNNPALLEKHAAEERERRKNPNYVKRATAYKNDWKSKQKTTDPSFRVAQLGRKHIYDALVGSCFTPNTQNLIGCDRPTLIKHFESLWKPGMSWDNYGKWHVDHIQPCVAFDLTDEVQLKACFHYTNLQPLWAPDSVKKNHTRARLKREMEKV
jgi:hypothetical protein